MTQHLFAAETGPSEVNLDANFTELYNRTQYLSSSGLNLGTSGAWLGHNAALSVNYAGGGTIFGATFNTTATTGKVFDFIMGGDATGGGTTTAVGSVTVTTTATSYNTTSDYRLKSSPTPITNSGAFIDALKPCSWTWVQDNSSGAGFLAHEFAAVSPTSVVGAKDAVDANGRPVFQAMDASSPEMIANIVAELQSLRMRMHAVDGH